MCMCLFISKSKKRVNGSGYMMTFFYGDCCSLCARLNGNLANLDAICYPFPGTQFHCQSGSHTKLG